VYDKLNNIVNEKFYRDARNVLESIRQKSNLNILFSTKRALQFLRLP
jgi:hypothetical protein